MTGSQAMAALGAPRRREILRLLRAGERSAGELHRALPDVTFGAVSQHLRVLADAGLVAVRPHGRERFYRGLPERLGPLRPWLESLWDDALYRLKLLAELEAGRRGPRPGRAAKRTRRAPGPRRAQRRKGGER
jgi:DNA-binding transcriptional ArsR family regulator